MTELIELLNRGVSPYQVVKICEDRLTEAGYEALSYAAEWKLELGHNYYVSPYPSMTIAFAMPEQMTESTKVKLAMAHTDYPCFKLKSNPEYTTKQYLQANVEPYGGMIKSTWFDRPLQLAGKVMLRSDDIYCPKTVFFESGRALFVIPSLAPHLDRDANGKHEYDMQVEVQPVAGLIEQIEDTCNRENYLLTYLADALKVAREEILSYDLFLTNREEAELIGLKKEFLSSPRLDNLASVAALVEAMCQRPDQTINPDETSRDLCIIGLFDNEEIGSRSKQGADSMLLSQILYKIGKSLLCDTCKVNDMIARGFLISVDGAQAFHPNYTAKSDPTNEVYPGNGVVIKTSASQRYVTDSAATAVIMQLCERAGVKCQQQVNRSGMPGGTDIRTDCILLSADAWCRSWFANACHAFSQGVGGGSRLRRTDKITDYLFSVELHIYVRNGEIID